MRECPVESSAGLGIRVGGDRRQGDRRAASHGGAERRRGDRRRRTAAGGLILSALSIGGLLHQGRPSDVESIAIAGAQRPAPAAPVAPDRAYDDLIAEASAEYRVDPQLVRAVIRAESQ